MEEMTLNQYEVLFPKIPFEKTEYLRLFRRVNNAIAPGASA